MPIKVKQDLPAVDVLENENIFVMTEKRAITQDIRPLKILVLNLMPTKIETETQILRKLSNTPLQLEVEFLRTVTYESRHADKTHLDEFYLNFDDVKNRYFDGMIITGAPLDDMEYEDVDYWPELCKIMDWAKHHVHCTLNLCWGAFAWLYHFYKIPKIEYESKLSGIYEHQILKRKSPFFRGFDETFFAPQSRMIGLNKNDILKVPELEVLAESDKTGITMIKTRNSRQFFVLCHLEYDKYTLKSEYDRDTNKGMSPQIPENYFPDNDPKKDPVVRWRSAGQLMYTNWINYYVYQTTPYDIENVENEKDIFE